MAKAREPEAGFALLLIFCMAAIIGIMLYVATPRVAFEAQRDQEQLLIDRGEQYKRAIQLYYRAFHRYPAKLEDLENTANQRFLRRLYKDPMSGQSEWRLIHVGPGGMLVDSVNKPAQKPGRESSVNNFITELQGLGTPPPGTGATEGLGMRRRPSDQAGAAGNGAPLDPNAIANAAGAGVASSVPPGVQPNGIPPNGVPPGFVPQAGIPQGIGPDGRPLPSAPYYGAGSNANPNANPAQASGYPNPTGAYAVNPQSPSAGQLPGQPGAPPGVPGNNPAAQIIQRLLTSPRPGGFPGQPPVSPDQFGNAPAASAPVPAPSNTPGGFYTGVAAQPGPGMGAANASAFNSGQPGQMVGGGIAGVASTVEREGIKVYQEKTKYNQWEFIYDYGKEAGAMQMPPGAGGQPNVTGNNPAGNNPAGNNPLGSNANPMGNVPGNPGFGNLPQAGSPPPIRP